MIGGNDAVPNAQLSSFMQTNVVSNRAYMSLICRNGFLSAVAQNSNGPRVMSTTIDVITANNVSLGRQYYMMLEGGTLSIFKDRTLIGSISGAPTLGLVAGNTGVWVNHSATLAATATQRRMHVYNMDMIWE
jgi:hypothetical protein